MNNIKLPLIYAAIIITFITIYLLKIKLSRKNDILKFAAAFNEIYISLIDLGRSPYEILGLPNDAYNEEVTRKSDKLIKEINENKTNYNSEQLDLILKAKKIILNNPFIDLVPDNSKLNKNTKILSERAVSVISDVYQKNKKHLNSLELNELNKIKVLDLMVEEKIRELLTN